MSCDVRAEVTDVVYHLKKFACFRYRVPAIGTVEVDGCKVTVDPGWIGD